MTKRVKTTLTVPDWARDAVWYQVFPERFRNGDPENDPRLEDITDRAVPGWQVCPWGMDWYRQQDWEKPLGDFFKSVYLRRFGGDLAGIREKLDYLQELGVNALYLNPIFMAPSLHKYDAACLHHVDPTFGPDREGDLDLIARAGETEDPGTWVWTAADRDFVDLVADIHRRGMRIIIDGVFNHTGTRFFAFRDLQRDGRRSRYRRWYRVTKWRRDGTFDYLGWFNSKGLPEFGRGRDDLAAPVREYVFDITRRWMDPNGDGDPSDGVDGWRLDVAFCVPHGFWKKWRRWVKRINPDAYLTAEIVSFAEEFLRGDEFDAVMNYMWLFPSVRFFSRGRHGIGARELRRQLDRLRAAYPEKATPVLQNLLDSHDVGRIATVLKNRLPLKADWDTYFNLSRVAANPRLDTTKPDRETLRILRQMAIFQMTYPGAPMIYYGTEVGLWGANDPDDRQPMLWDDVRYEPERRTFDGACRPARKAPDRELFEFFRRAIALRHKHRVLRRGSFAWVQTGHDRLLAFERSDEDAEVLVVLNAGDEPLPFRLDFDARDLWRGGRKVRRGRLRIEPSGWRVLAAD